ncbi:hypothetical protein BKG82_26360 [Mycobacteroides chelonae]|uniref:Uncharacterized protein n=1 Tax=Mycobacteroides chelonae TaxID=1774 RepID=A0A1S1LC15_MYCCH|nr:hypothetical protein [Mycobacteroides chelonae]OHU47183.1 hypothetical protein BKG82_26360 [Mycobacteroides chelonae]
MSALSALLHIGDVLHPQRRYELAADYVAGALDVHLHDHPARIASLDDAAQRVGACAAGVFTAVRSNDIEKCAQAFTALAVATLRVSAELPDPYQLSQDRAYGCARQNAWGELLSANEKYPRTWASVHEGLGVVMEKVVEFVEAAVAGAVEDTRAEGAQVVAMCVRFLADLTNVGAAAGAVASRGAA